VKTECMIESLRLLVQVSWNIRDSRIETTALGNPAGPVLKNAALSVVTNMRPALVSDERTSVLLVTELIALTSLASLREAKRKD
jgi:hypothetical protein